VPRGPDSHASKADRLAGLIECAASGNEAAFGELYDQTSGRVYGAALQMLRSPQLAAEVTQEVYVEIWQRASGYRPDKGSVLAWMLSMLHVRCMELLRAIDKQTGRDRYATGNGIQATDRGSDEIAVSRLDTERARAAFRSLDEIDRRAVTLAYFNGYSHTEVARVLGLPPGTAKSRIRNGLIGLRDALGAST
jgi:RNA polymerase sigma-70 factor, ECF subfamily